MRIDDLSYLGVISEDAALVGGNRWRRQPRATALAGAEADAIGFRTTSETFTNATAVAGLFSSSTSGSYAHSVGLPVA